MLSINVIKINILVNILKLVIFSSSTSLVNYQINNSNYNPNFLSNYSFDTNIMSNRSSRCKWKCLVKLFLENIKRLKNKKNKKHSPLSIGFPFYTIGRFPNDVCNGRNNLIGTCLVRGECRDNGGIFAGSCSTITTQAVCCTCT